MPSINYAFARPIRLPSLAGVVRACACCSAVRAGGVVVLVGPVGGGPVGRGHRNLRTAASIRWPIHRTFGTAQLLPSALYRGPSGHWSAGFPRQGMAV